MLLEKKGIPRFPRFRPRSKTWKAWNVEFCLKIIFVSLFSGFLKHFTGWAIGTPVPYLLPPTFATTPPPHTHTHFCSVLFYNSPATATKHRIPPPPFCTIPPPARYTHRYHENKKQIYGGGNVKLNTIPFCRIPPPPKRKTS